MMQHPHKCREKILQYVCKDCITLKIQFRVCSTKRHQKQSGGYKGEDLTAPVRVSVDCVLQRQTVQPHTVKHWEQKHLSETSLSSAKPEFLHLSEGSSLLCTFSEPSPQRSSYPWLAIRDSWRFLASSESRQKMTDVIWWLGLILQPAVTDTGKVVVFLTSSLPY